MTKLIVMVGIALAIVHSINACKCVAPSENDTLICASNGQTMNECVFMCEQQSDPNLVKVKDGI